MRIAHRLLQKEIPKSEAPTAMAESVMAFLWVIREERKPEHKRDTK